MGATLSNIEWFWLVKPGPDSYIISHFQAQILTNLASLYRLSTHTIKTRLQKFQPRISSLLQRIDHSACAMLAYIRRPRHDNDVPSTPTGHITVIRLWPALSHKI